MVLGIALNESGYDYNAHMKPDCFGLSSTTDKSHSMASAM